MKQYSNNMGQTFADQLSMFTSQKMPGQVASNAPVIITRAKTTQAKAATSWTATAIQVSNPSTGTNSREGSDNVDFTNLCDFLFDKTVDVRPTTDTIAFTDEFGVVSRWKVLSVSNTTIGTNNLDIVAHCTRSSPFGTTV